MSDYTPTKEEVRNRYISEVFPEDDAEFDRWLASVKAEAWEEGVIAAEVSAGFGRNEGLQTIAHIGNPYRADPEPLISETGATP